jgi:DNA-binding beta-propeller fold protein YncE
MRFGRVLSLIVGLLAVVACGPPREQGRSAPPTPSVSEWTASRGWPRLPAGLQLGETTGVGVDSHNHVFVFHRVDRRFDDPPYDLPIESPPIVVFDGATGELLDSLGAGRIVMPHGLSIGPDDTVWVTDVGTHQLHRFSHEGELLRTWGEVWVPGPDERHFGRPTDLASTADGTFYVVDGYDNARVVRFDPTGRFELQWGSPGRQPGQLRLPHGVAVTAEGRVLVADRGNARLQIFDPAGRLHETWRREKVGRPYGVAVGPEGSIYVVDGGDQPDATTSRVLVFDRAGALVSSFDAAGPGDPRPLGHDIAVGPDGSVYVADVWARRIRKFERAFTPPDG